MEHGRISGLPKFLGGTPIISGTGKAMNFEFYTHIYRLNRNKNSLKIFGKVYSCGHSQGLPKIFRVPCIGRIDSSAALLSL